jgi:acetyl-CoA C-acetyltransferase
MREAVIVPTARTPIGRVYRSAFNATSSPTLAAHATRAAVERAGVDPAEIDDVIIGAAMQQGVQVTIGRNAALRAGLPVTISGIRSIANVPPGFKRSRMRPIRSPTTA